MKCLVYGNWGGASNGADGRMGKGKLGQSWECHCPGGLVIATVAEH